MGVPNRLGMKDWIVLETQEDAYNMRVLAAKPVIPAIRKTVWKVIDERQNFRRTRFGT